MPFVLRRSTVGRVKPRGGRNYPLVLACILVVVGCTFLAFTLTAWSLVAVPFAGVIGVAAWFGMTFRAAAKAIVEGPYNDDPGSGAPGMNP